MGPVPNLIAEIFPCEHGCRSWSLSVIFQCWCEFSAFKEDFVWKCHLRFFDGVLTGVPRSSLLLRWWLRQVPVLCYSDMAVVSRVDAERFRVVWRLCLVGTNQLETLLGEELLILADVRAWCFTSRLVVDLAKSQALLESTFLCGVDFSCQGSESIHVLFCIPLFLIHDSKALLWLGKNRPICRLNGPRPCFKSLLRPQPIQEIRRLLKPKQLHLHRRLVPRLLPTRMNNRSQKLPLADMFIRWFEINIQQFLNSLIPSGKFVLFHFGSDLCFENAFLIHFQFEQWWVGRCAMACSWWCCTSTCTSVPSSWAVEDELAYFVFELGMLLDLSLNDSIGLLVHIYFMKGLAQFQLILVLLQWLCQSWVEDLLLSAVFASQLDGKCGSINFNVSWCFRFSRFSILFGVLPFFQIFDLRYFRLAPLRIAKYILRLFITVLLALATRLLLEFALLLDRDDTCFCLWSRRLTNLCFFIFLFLLSHKLSLQLVFYFLVVLIVNDFQVYDRPFSCWRTLFSPRLSISTRFYHYLLIIVDLLGHLALHLRLSLKNRKKLIPRPWSWYWTSIRHHYRSAWLWFRLVHWRCFLTYWFPCLLSSRGLFYSDAVQGVGDGWLTLLEAPYLLECIVSEVLLLSWTVEAWGGLEITLLWLPWACALVQESSDIACWFLVVIVCYEFSIPSRGRLRWKLQFWNKDRSFLFIFYSLLSAFHRRSSKTRPKHRIIELIQLHLRFIPRLKNRLYLALNLLFLKCIHILHDFQRCEIRDNVHLRRDYLVERIIVQIDFSTRIPLWYLNTGSEVVTTDLVQFIVFNHSHDSTWALALRSPTDRVHVVWISECTIILSSFWRYLYINQSVLCWHLTFQIWFLLVCSIGSNHFLLFFNLFFDLFFQIIFEFYLENAVFYKLLMLQILDTVLFDHQFFVLLGVTVFLSESEQGIDVLYIGSIWQFSFRISAFRYRIDLRTILLQKWYKQTHVQHFHKFNIKCLV